MRTATTPACHPAVRWAAALAAGCLLAACTGRPRGRRAPWPVTAVPPWPPGRVVPHVVILSGGAAAGGGPVFFIGAGGGGGSRPKITVPPIPPSNPSLPIAMPLEAYQAISTQEQAALADASNLLIQHCMAVRGFEDTSSGSAPFSSVATLGQVEAAGAGLTSLTQARTFGFARPRAPGPPDPARRSSVSSARPGSASR